MVNPSWKHSLLFVLALLLSLFMICMHTYIVGCIYSSFPQLLASLSLLTILFIHSSYNYFMTTYGNSAVSLHMLLWLLNIQGMSKDS